MASPSDKAPAPPDSRSAAAQRFAGEALARFIRLVFRTSRIVCEPEDMGAFLSRHHPAIFACWHGQFMMLSPEWPEGLPVKAIVARHGDAGVLAATLASFGVVLIRGAGAGARRKNRGGAYALRAAVRTLNEGASLVSTADVPPGPARRAGEGIVTMARLSGRPIIPVAAATSRYKAFDTWSRLTLNLPFSKLAYVAGAPLHVPRDAAPETLEACRVRLEEALNGVTRRAYELAGGDLAGATPPAADPGRPPPPPGVLLRSYGAAANVVRPLAPFLLRVRARQGKEDMRRSGERFGEATAARPTGSLAWFHAASVGETNAVFPVIAGLAAARPGTNVLLTTGTLTSAAFAKKKLDGAGIHQYLPLDVPVYVRAFLDHWQPDLAVFTESEIWPNLIMETAARGIPLALANGRMSQRSFSRWRRIRKAARPLFSRFSVVLAQNGVLARRFSELGARKVIAAGNLKIDAPPPPADPQETARLGQAIGRRPVFAAVSTHEGEERAIAEAHRRLAGEIRGLCTIIAPRHPERGTAIASLMRELGLSAGQRSAGALPDARMDVYVADTLGELGTFYALCPVVFVGGSLVDKGGHNPAEPIRHGCAVLTGPHWTNFADMYRALARHGGVLTVHSADELAATVLALHRDETRLLRLAANGAAGLASLPGALETTLKALLDLLPEDERAKRAV